LNRPANFIGAMAQSNADQAADIVPPLADRRTAKHLGRRVAEAAIRWHRDEEAGMDRRCDETTHAMQLYF
ncbi:hypothetical protein, partial [Acinetobacter baumannii]|uniref:hypothetical protein n=1 Tax=Acinetobacter baumannii TaxID=470 RepID=UPI002091ABFD